MTKSRLPLPLSTLVLLVACNQVTSALTMGGQEQQPAAATAGATDTKAAPTDPATPQTPTVVLPTGPASVDDLLGLVHEGASTYAIFRTPDTLLSVAETAAATVERPIVTLAAATKPEKVAELTQNIAQFKTSIAEARTALTQAGTDLQRGVVVTSTRAGDDEPVVVFNASSADAAKGLFSALKVPSAPQITCTAVAARSGYVACSKDAEAVAAYKPGDATPARHRLNTALPAVAIDELAVFGYAADGDVHFGFGQPAAGFTFHMSAPPDTRELFTSLTAGPADLLRFAPAGTGFLWMKLDMAELKKKGGEIPPPLTGTVDNFTGELLFGGSAAPPALQMRLGFSDTTALAALTDLAITFGGPMLHNKPIPAVPGSKVTFKAETLTLGTDKARALHFGLSGVPAAKKIADQLGLSLDAWVYPAENTLAAVFGVDNKHVGDVKAAASADATLAALPPALAASLRAGEVNMIAHIPLDGLQSPELLKLIDGALAKLPGYDATATHAGLGIASPLSSTTMWVTEHQNAGVFHFALQTIGNTSDDEGKEALAAAASADPAKAFAELATKYPNSPRLAAYQARAGHGGPGALVGGSAPTLALAASTFAFLLRSTGADTEVVSIVETPPVAVPVPPSDPPKVEEPKVEEPKVEEPKVEAPKVEEPKTETPKTETPKTETPKTETPKTETPKTETPTDPAPKRIPKGNIVIQQK